VTPLRRRVAALLLLLAVLALHAWLGQSLALARLGEGAADTRPQRLDVAFVRVLAPAAPVAVVAPPPRRSAPAAVPAAPPVAPAEPVAEAASAPGTVAAAEPPASAPVAEVMAVAAERPPPAPPVPPTPAPTPAPAASAAAPAFDWPPSTRLSYRLTGHYRGPVDGSAQVQWLRDGGRYQVHLDVLIGPPFAPLITRQMSSDGTLGAEGLVPRRYDERTKVMFRDARLATLQFDGQEVQLANGRRVAQPAGVQDTVSQFVQLSWRFTLRPELLREGQVLEVPLALPRRVETWVYDVRAPETLLTPAGPVDAVRVQPRREPRPGGDLVAEMWFAPTLQYLPVRIVIRQDAETFIDLLIDRLPEQAAAVQPPASAPKRVP
jgi:Protein of unknown function (DUF3108)